ncbi:3-oxoacyl-ACP reductase family protein [Nonomuraea turcica]|uniref:3-oxoacyl-ACP reductase family protein n=1 Tax=Nonomuraea sp. G32 TaxID=3067274 RepID=UPI00273CC103|nr:3-oxoacyl-ACP reductase family protein [Nonomuraea sp. G32]MDP4510090.1 3-oxoacyl-ACP reductase family protein [Nonomuraea sp. G32]
MTQQLAGKSALVTGGSRGIGAAIVRRLAREGARVAFTYTSAKDQADALVAEVTAAGGRALAVQADSADPQAVQDAVDRTVEELGALDILVNNAGVAHVAPLEEFPLKEFDRMIAVNVRGVFTAIQAAAPHLGRGGRIITIGSINADRVPVPGTGVYSLTKAAVAGLSRGLARELGPRGITVNTIQPGPTETDMNPDSGPFAESMKAMLPVGHYAQPADIASAVAYLAGPEARFVTGASWDVDGGFAV